jgi:hypothetical protein
MKPELLFNVLKHPKLIGLVHELRLQMQALCVHARRLAAMQELVSDGRPAM